MLGPGHYGVPVGMEISHGAGAGTWSLGPYIYTHRNAQNWFSYALPPPRDSACTSEQTCLKCLSPFFVDNTLTCIAAFNRDAKPWGEPKADKEDLECSLLTITFLPGSDDLIYFSATEQDQYVLRDGLNTQELLAHGRPAIFQGRVKDIPAVFHTPRVDCDMFDPGNCPCGSDDKHKTRHKATGAHKAWMRRQQELAESQAIAGEAYVVPRDGLRWWTW